MAQDEHETTRLSNLSSRLFLQVEHIAYIALGVVLAATALIALGSAVESLFHAAMAFGEAEAIILTIDRLLFVLMLVEILHTVRASMRSGTLTAEPFLIVGLIASIRRVLVITLESSQVNQPGKWTPETQAVFNSTMLELGVLGVLILIMVASIYLLRTRPSTAQSDASG